MKRNDLKAIRIFLTSISTAMALTMVGCEKKTDHFIEYTEETTTQINYDKIMDIIVTWRENLNCYEITYGPEKLGGIFAPEDWVYLETIEEVKGFISKCHNLQYLTTNNNGMEILESVVFSSNLIEVKREEHSIPLDERRKINYDKIMDIIVIWRENLNCYEITYGPEKLGGTFAPEDWVYLETLEEVEDFISKCHNLQYLTINDNCYFENENSSSNRTL